MNTEQQRAAFEAWASQYTNYPQKYDQIPAWLAYQAGYQAALASPEVQALRDALENLLNVHEGKGGTAYPADEIARAALAAMGKHR